ncbi:MAG TPA: hypothetical protein VMF11_10545 [Candidatus Baltobacteraceae bacterium]|nr:hypothetical protein [Candidatus Baltobacteraceae bacterium]
MRGTLALAFALALAACSTSDPQSTASAVTRAVYQDDPAAVAPYFDDALQAQVSRASVGVLSDRMHALGNYTGLTLLGMDTGKHEYTYRANFSKGTMDVVVRLDSNGRLAAYRASPG